MRLVATAAVPAAAGAWTVSYLADSDVRPSAVASPSDLAGTWQEDDGTARIRLGADGSFDATSVDRILPRSVSAASGTAGTAGTWTLVRSDFVTLTVADGHRGDPDGFAVVETGHTRKLCVPSGSPGVRCDSLLHRVSP